MIQEFLSKFPKEAQQAFFDHISKQTPPSSILTDVKPTEVQQPELHLDDQMLMDTKPFMPR